ncbi:hypothetical protein L3Y34_004800 [Caenorhabditis briggsae]|uniref:Uncharacterized protein n=1 Tax=Caenorhabditis briggsae TaxID=6238 RepID=A0AAE9ACP1_CAEBR|nr:hypothetical protein L3Y34_004800 [Caenorhabditis briggsae]
MPGRKLERFLQRVIARIFKQEDLVSNTRLLTAQLNMSTLAMEQPFLQREPSFQFLKRFKTTKKELESFRIPFGRE